MNWLIRLFFALVLSLGFTHSAIAQVTAEWTLVHVDYDPSMSNAVGMTVFFEFHVTSGSGYIDLVGTLGKGLSIVTGGTTQTTKMWVDEGGDYEVEMVLEFWGNRKITSSLTNCFYVTFDSSAFSNAHRHTISALQGSTGISWCPDVAQRVGQDEDAFQLNASDGEFADHVEVTWNEIEGANTYRVFRCIDIDDSSCGGLIGLTSDNFYNDTEGLADTTYWYRVKSCSPEGCSDFSQADTGYRGESGGPVTPDIPTGVNATDGTLANRVRISWNGTAGSTHYKIYRCTNDNDSSCGSPIGEPDNVSFDDTGGVTETSYWYRVKACADDVCSSFSEADTGYSRTPSAGARCDETFVQQDENELVINVAPTGVNDTVNIQCALDTAVETGIPTVRLEANTYHISNLIVEDFKGTFEGKTKTATTVNVIDASIDCAAMNKAGLIDAVIKFVKGEPRIRFMTISADRPCLSGQIDAIVNFTGESRQADNCDNDVIFAVVDRVVIDGISTRLKSGIAAVEVGPEGGCKDTLLGTFKLNRSTIIDTHHGVVTSMRSGAQVDINFNEFRDNLQAVSLYDTNQNTTITTNKFYGDNSQSYSYTGIRIYNYLDTPPSSTRLVVHNNDFNVSALTNVHRSSSAINLSNTADINISSIITGNRFNLRGVNASGVKIYNISNSHVSANRFSGDGLRAIIFSGSTPVSGCTITSNMGFADFISSNGEDIRLSANTSNCIIGPDQGASIRDDGTDNTILPQ